MKDNSNHVVTDEELTELKRVAKLILAETRMNFQRQFPFVGSISMSLDLVPTRDPDYPTAATDGRSVFFDIDFLSKLSPSERMFVLGHEVYHNVMMHFLRTEGRDREMFNIATDLEVNQILAEDGLMPPPQCLMPEQFNFPKKLSAEQYYEMLLEKQKQMKQNGGMSSMMSGSGNGSSSSSSSDSGSKLNGQFDKHIYVKDGGMGDDDDGNGSKNDGQRPTADRYGKLDKKDPDCQPNLTPAAVEKIREAAIAAAQNIERMCGTLPDHLKSLVEGLLKPEVNWREMLQQHVTKAITNETSWNRPNRRFAYSGVYLPGRDGKQLKVAVGIDTSGSCCSDIKKFLSEVDGIVKAFGNYEMTIIQCDAKVQKVDTYNEERPADFEHEKFDVSGGGGTQLRPIFDYIDLNDVEADVCIVFTDGYISDNFTEHDMPNYPVIWVLTKDNNKSNLTFGEIVEFKES